jgi:ATP-binding protein involved in chromosome partitioning
MSGNFEPNDPLSQKVLESLKQIQDPDLNKDIVSLGFVKEILLKKTLLGSFDISVTIELTTPACPVKDEFKKQAEQLIKAIPNVAQVHIKMTAQVRAPKTLTGSGVPGVKNIIAVGAGKGGVGKSTISINLALALSALGSRVGVLDGDIYGPSFGLMLGLSGGMPEVVKSKILPKIAHGIPTMTFAFFNPVGEATLYRGAMAGKALTQMLTEVQWNLLHPEHELDYLIVDLPPGTGDIAISLTHSAKISGAIVVTTPQKASLIDAEKAVAMYQKLNVPVLGVVENMKSFYCENCHHENNIFESPESKQLIKDFCASKKVPYLGDLPLSKEIVIGGETGKPFFVFGTQELMKSKILEIAKQVARQHSISTFVSPTDG